MVKHIFLLIFKNAICLKYPIASRFSTIFDRWKFWKIVNYSKILSEPKIICSLLHWVLHVLYAWLIWDSKLSVHPCSKTCSSLTFQKSTKCVGSNWDPDAEVVTPQFYDDWKAWNWIGLVAGILTFSLICYFSFIKWFQAHKLKKQLQGKYSLFSTDVFIWFFD